MSPFNEWLESLKAFLISLGWMPDSAHSSTINNEEQWEYYYKEGKTPQEAYEESCNEANEFPIDYSGDDECCGC